MIFVNNPKLTLRIAEARTKDVGRDIARIDPADMATLDVQVGDIVIVEGKRKTPCKVMPQYFDDRGKTVIQIDGLIRQNAHAGLGEMVNVEKSPYKQCQRIVLSPVTAMRTLPKDMRYLSGVLDGMAVCEGDRIRATLLGTKWNDFMVSTVIPNDVVVINNKSIIEILTETRVAERARVSYEDIGGLKKEIRKIREMIELPIRRPEVFERLGIEAPKGVFLYGPPGCGKTLIARAVANETEAYFVHMTGSEVMHKFYGESEAHLRSVFEEASKNAPSIIFIDEIDAMAPKRADIGAEKQVERRVVAQLLALMDGMESRGQVIVIGATNLPNMVDPALRRPGRFDREIEISIPDKKGRLEILTVHTRGMPLSEDVNLEKLASLTHGFVGADLEALCREAAMITLRKVFPSIESHLEEVPYETIMALEVTMDDFMEALKEVEPSALREVFVEIPDVKWGDIGGLEDIKEALRDAVELPLKYPELFRFAAARPPKGIILYGAPGTGKTLIIKALASESEVNFISIKGPELMSKWLGESERGVREVFHKAKQASPCIVFFDELESLVPKRGLGESHAAERVISQFLTEMDGIEELKGVLVVAATNRIDLIDEAILRAGRFDLIISFPMPDEKSRVEIFNVHTRGKPISKDVDITALAKMTDGLAGSDIEAVSREATLTAIKGFLKHHKETEYERLSITFNEFKDAIDSVRKRAHGVHH